MSRYDFLRKLNTVQSNTDSVQIQMYDILNVNWKKFKFAGGYKTHIITRQEVQKPWLICHKYNIDYVYEDIVFLINGISDLFADLIPGKTMKIPTNGDLKNFTRSIVQ